MWLFISTHKYFLTECKYSYFVLFKEEKKNIKYIECPKCKTTVTLFKTGQIHFGYERCYIAAHAMMASLTPRISLEILMVDQNTKEGEHASE